MRWGETVVGVSLGQSSVIYFCPDCRTQSGKALSDAVRSRRNTQYTSSDGPVKTELVIKETNVSFAIEIELPRRSIYIMSENARYELKHGIRAVKKPAAGTAPSWNPHGERRSLTLRAHKAYSNVYLERLAKKRPNDQKIRDRIDAQNKYGTDYKGMSEKRAKKVLQAALKLPTKLRFKDLPGAGAGVSRSFVGSGYRLGGGGSSGGAVGGGTKRARSEAGVICISDDDDDEAGGGGGESRGKDVDADDEREIARKARISRFE